MSSGIQRHPSARARAAAPSDAGAPPGGPVLEPRAAEPRAAEPRAAEPRAAEPRTAEPLRPAVYREIPDGDAEPMPSGGPAAIGEGRARRSAVRPEDG